ncbi:MAG: ATP-binding protein [Chitinispirillaceae bacterium]|nr:ATP-binding protein [Chitinispirillaceae bacterium]
MTTYKARSITTAVQHDLPRKMVFIAGPRQAGKTTFARRLCTIEGKDYKKSYLNWDVAAHRSMIIREEFPSETDFLILDEIHKYRRWRQVVKGLYDAMPGERKILVTGSARLDYYRHGGDSLQGRYRFHRLLPFCCKELGDPKRSIAEQLLRLGPFPEPFLSGSEKEARIWSRDYRIRLVEEDLRGLEKVIDTGLMEKLAMLLPESVGSPLSLNGLKEDLQVAHQTVSRWVKVLETVYMIFRIYPFTGSSARSVKKKAKHYHFDWTTVTDPGARFENMVAFHLLAWCWRQQDEEGRNIELRYYRDMDRREVDFVITEDERPIHFIDVKTSHREVSPSLRYLSGRFPGTPARQVALDFDDDRVTRERIRICGWKSLWEW